VSVSRPFDSSLVLYYKWSIVTMCLSGTVTEIWHFKDNGITSLTFWGSRDVIGHVTIRLLEVGYWIRPFRRRFVNLFGCLFIPI